MEQDANPGFWRPPTGEQRQFDGQLNDDYSIEVLVYRKSLIFIINTCYKTNGQSRKGRTWLKITPVIRTYYTGGDPFFGHVLFNQ